MKTPKPHPMQPIVWDGQGVIRFQPNPIVAFLLKWASTRGMSLNELAARGDDNGWTAADWSQFSQLHGYSVSGWFDLSYASDREAAQADAAVAALLSATPKDPGR